MNNTPENECCDKCGKHVRDRSYISRGQSRVSMTGVHVECKNTKCECHTTPPENEWVEEWISDLVKGIEDAASVIRSEFGFGTAYEEKLMEVVERLPGLAIATYQKGDKEGYHRGQEDMKRKAIEAAKEYLVEEFREPEDKSYNNGVRDCIYSLQALKTG